MQRRRHARNKNGQFLMLDAASGDTPIACHNAKSHAYEFFLHTAQAGEAINIRLADFNTCLSVHRTCLMQNAPISHPSGKRRKQDRSHNEPTVLRTSYVTCQL